MPPTCFLDGHLGGSDTHVRNVRKPSRTVESLHQSLVAVAMTQPRFASQLMCTCHRAILLTRLLQPETSVVKADGYWSTMLHVVVVTLGDDETR